MCRDTGQRAALEPWPGVEHPRRDRRLRRARRRARARARPASRAEVEPVVCEPPGVLALGRVPARRRAAPGPSGTRLLRSRRGRSRSARGRPGSSPATQALLEPGRIVGRVDARRQRDDLHVEALRDRELHPAQRRRLARRRRRRRRARGASSAGRARAAARSVSAVPMQATTGSKPACRSAITSVFPSTTHGAVLASRSPRAPCRARRRPRPS